MVPRPQANEAAEYYFRYINRVPDGDIVATLEKQLDFTLKVLNGISEQKSLYRYAPGKWSIREMMNHVNDTERIFASRALWFARGFDAPLPGFDQDVSAAAAHADQFAWASHVEEFRTIRQATLTLFRNLPAEAWTRTGTASGYVFSVNAMAYIIAGHVEHHLAVLQEKYR
ncbi:MAG: DinB family protein [Acidobacteriia bacterium]|nr:DinB family protein [Terriglobia bacterium]